MKRRYFLDLLALKGSNFNHYILLFLGLLHSTTSYADGFRCNVDDLSFGCVFGNIVFTFALMIPTFIVTAILLLFVKSFRQVQLVITILGFIFYVNFIHIKCFNPLPESADSLSFGVTIVGSILLVCVFVLLTNIANKYNWINKVTVRTTYLTLLMISGVFTFFSYSGVISYLEGTVGTVIKLSENICLSVNSQSCNFLGSSLSGTIHCLDGFELKFQTVHGVQHVGGAALNSLGYEESSKIENEFRTRVIELHDHKTSLIIVSNKRTPVGWGSHFITSCDLLISSMQNIMTHIPNRFKPRQISPK